MLMCGNTNRTRREIGYQLSLIQAGRSASDWKSIPIVGTGVFEIRVHAEGNIASSTWQSLRTPSCVACLRQEDSKGILT